MPDRPLTDSELSRIAETAERGVWLTARREDVLRLVAEVRRLQSDGWLQLAIVEIGKLNTREGYIDTAKVLAILQRHRDSKA